MQSTQQRALHGQHIVTQIVRGSDKHGAAPGDAANLAEFIVRDCPHLELRGLMTIGQIDRVVAAGEQNPDFLVCWSKEAKRSPGI